MGKCKFQLSWLNKTDCLGVQISLWLRRGKHDGEGFCSVCESSFLVNKGYQSVTQHVESTKHKKMYA